MPERILKVLRYTVTTTVVFSILFFAVGWFFPDEIIILFVKPTAEIMTLNKPIMQLYFVSFLFLGINTVVVYILQSVEKNVAAAMLTLLRGVILIAVLLFTLPVWFGSNGIWYSVILNDLLIAAASVFCLWKMDMQLQKMADGKRWQEITGI